MDYGLIGGVDALEPAFEPARHAMGDTRRFAERINLIAMEPRDDVSSTGYALASAGDEYLVLDPNDDGRPFTLALEPGTYAAEWYAIETRETIPGDEASVESRSTIGCRPPAETNGPIVLYLKKVRADRAADPQRLQP